MECGLCAVKGSLIMSLSVDSAEMFRNSPYLLDRLTDEFK